MAMNNQCAQYCIDVIRALMQEEPISAIPDTVSLAELYDFSKMHGVEAMVHHGLVQLEMDEADPIWQNWQNRADMLLTQSIVQLAERDMLFAALPAAGIKLLPVKGCWLKEQYPAIDYRQMSDLDILIPEADVQKAKQCMLEQGYTPEAEVAENHDCYFKHPYMEVELHRSLLRKDESQYHYYDDVWENAVQEEACPGVYRLKTEDEYIYYLLHLHKHILGAGTGLRTILDCVVYRDAYPDMERDYLHHELERLGLWGFAQEIETLSDCWFRTGTPVPETLANLVDIIIAAGSYGTYEILSRQRMDRIQEKYKNPLVRAVAYWVIQICRPREEMEHNYPVLKKLPVLLPVCWIIRAVRKFAAQPKGVMYHIRVVFGGAKKHD